MKLLKLLKYFLLQLCIMPIMISGISNEKDAPRWEMNPETPITIPLKGLTSAGIILSSNENVTFELSFIGRNKEMLIREYIQPLQTPKYIIEVCKHSSMVSIYIQNVNDDGILLMSAYVIDEFESLVVRSNEGTLHVRLDPLWESNCGGMSNISVNNLKDSKNIFNGYLSIGICWIVLAFLIIYLLKGILSRSKKQGDKTSDREEDGTKNPSVEKTSDGEEDGTKNPSVEKVSAKYKIKLENTKSYDEIEPDQNIFKKEICKLNLISDIKNENKKILGEMSKEHKTKVILVVGETGSGKSSAINAMANSIYGVTYEDSYRFKLIDVGFWNDSGENTTEEITSYYIPYTPGILYDFNYILIDTPGFGDLRGIDEDKKLIRKFYDFLKKNPEISEVDAICYVIKSSDTRLTDAHKYIINGLFSMFGKDIKRNIYVIVSFSDGTEILVPKILEDSGLESELEIYFNSDGLFNDMTKIEESSEKKVQEYFFESWKVTMDHLKTFFEKLRDKAPVSLILTNIVLEENRDITKLTEELLNLIVKKINSPEKEKQLIQSKIDQDWNLLMIKVEEAKKLNERLKDIPCKEYPLTINKHIDILIRSEKDKNKIKELVYLKERNTQFQELLKEPNYDFFKYFLEKKNI